jgi:hypothetical protein
MHDEKDDEDRECEAAEGRFHRKPPDTIDLSELIGPDWLNLGWKSREVDLAELSASPLPADAGCSGSPRTATADGEKEMASSRKRSYKDSIDTADDADTGSVSPVTVAAADGDMTGASSGTSASPMESNYIYDGSDLALPASHATDLSFESLLVEVKGPNDHLSEKQMVWLSVFRKHGVNALVCRVTEKLGDKANVET